MSSSDNAAFTMSEASRTRPEGPTDVAEGPECPALASGVELFGELQGSGFQDRQWLIQRGGRFIQVTELLYRVAEQANGKRTLADIAARVTDTTDWLVSAEQVRYLIRTKLVPLGIVAPTVADAAPFNSEPTRSPLQLKLRVKVLGPEFIDPITGVLKHLFAPWLFLPVLVGLGGAHAWLYFDHGIGEPVEDVLYTPGALLLVTAIVLLSGVVHEFGHAAALRYGGGQVRGMGAGVYLFFPAFYTDTTDSYRLGRWARVRTDLGGFYFHLIFAAGIMGLYRLTGREYLLVAVLLINLDIFRQCLPFVRFDGYWALADLTGIPDFFSQMGAFIRSVVPIPAWKGSKLPRLKPWARIVFVVYVFVGIPVLAFLLFRTVRAVPGTVETAWNALGEHGDAITSSWRAGDFLGVVTRALQILLLMLPLLALTYFLTSLTWRLARTAWQQPTLPRRLAGGVIIAAMAGLIAFLWMPRLFTEEAQAPAGVQSFEVTERTHVDGPVTYAQVPPVGGNHAPIWQNCGFYDAPIANENAVHSLEHGAVWITYRPGLPDEQVDALRRLAEEQPFVLVSPYPNLPAAAVASAWGHQLRLDAIGDPRLDQFVRAFQLGPQTPERGAPCSGGTGEPAG